MISGFNTDVECAGTVYHVQTEDKGAPHHVIMSLVYDKGTILASRREAYETATSEKELKERLDKQHKLICAAVKAGRVDDLKQMTAAARNGAKKAKSSVAAETIETEPALSAPVVAVRSLATNEPPVLPHPLDAAISIPEIPLRELADPPKPEADVPDELPIIELDGIQILEEYAENVPEAVEVVSELSGQARPTHDRLGIELLGDGKFRSGDRKTVNILISRGSDHKVVEGAQIMIKVLGSSFRPVIFHARSDANGLARVHLQVPQFSAGRAALLVRAMADGEEVELRRLVSSNS